MLLFKNPKGGEEGGREGERTWSPPGLQQTAGNTRTNAALVGGSFVTFVQTIKRLAAAAAVDSLVFFFVGFCFCPLELNISWVHFFFFHISCCGGKIRYSPVSCFQNQCLVFSIRIIIPARIVCSVFPTGKTITWTTASHFGFQPKVSFNYICSISSGCTETLKE